MSYPRFDGFVLQDDNYVTSEIEYRTSPNRSLEYERLGRRPGVKLFSHEFAERKVKLSGFILADDATDLQSKIDDLHRNVTRKDEGALYITSSRSATATVTSVGIADPHYAQDFVPFEVEFLLADPFFYGSSQTVNIPVTSGTVTTNHTITISGSVFAMPTLTYSAPTGVGMDFTTTSGIIVTYTNTGETLTWSGSNVSNPSLAYGGSVSFDYNNHRILEDTSEVNNKGVFSRWEPETVSFGVTFSGTALGGSLSMSYVPRYL